MTCVRVGDASERRMLLTWLKRCLGESDDFLVWFSESGASEHGLYEYSIYIYAWDVGHREGVKAERERHGRAVAGHRTAHRRKRKARSA